MITLVQLKRFAPAGRTDILQVFVDRWADIEKAGIITPLRTRQFMAQVAVETAGLTRLDENLNYSATRLMQVWPRRFPTRSSAAPYANNPQALANKTYGGRLGNRLPNDGWTYRGSGLFDTTGRDNYRAAGHESDPETLRQPVGALLSALQYWTSHNLNKLADVNNIAGIRQAVQGATLGLDDAKEYLIRGTPIFI